MNTKNNMKDSSQQNNRMNQGQTNQGQKSSQEVNNRQTNQQDKGSKVQSGGNPDNISDPQIGDSAVC